MPTLIVHISNEDPVMGDVDALPALSDQLIMLKNPRRKDGKDITNIEASVTVVFYPVSRLTYIEVLPSGEDEEIISFVRER
jgi:hypothetical protein